MRVPSLFVLSCLLFVLPAATVSAQDDQAIETLERVIRAASANAVLRATKEATVLEWALLTSAALTLYPSLFEYLAAERQESGCKKISEHCVACPSCRVYCTNSSRFIPLPGVGEQVGASVFEKIQGQQRYRYSP
jgi:hypothetical protein